jgi:hypothetical protein
MTSFCHYPAQRGSPLFKEGLEEIFVMTAILKSLFLEKGDPPFHFSLFTFHHSPFTSLKQKHL